MPPSGIPAEYQFRFQRLPFTFIPVQQADTQFRQICNGEIVKLKKRRVIVVRCENDFRTGPVDSIRTGPALDDPINGRHIFHFGPMQPSDRILGQPDTEKLEAASGESIDSGCVIGKPESSGKQLLRRQNLPVRQRTAVRNQPLKTSLPARFPIHRMNQAGIVEIVHLPLQTIIPGKHQIADQILCGRNTHPKSRHFRSPQSGWRTERWQTFAVDGIPEKSSGRASFQVMPSADSHTNAP